MSFGREVRRIYLPDVAVGAANRNVKSFTLMALQGGTMSDPQLRSHHRPAHDPAIEAIADTPQSVVEYLLELLHAEHLRMTDLFSRLDSRGSGRVRPDDVQRCVPPSVWRFVAGGPAVSACAPQCAATPLANGRGVTCSFMRSQGVHVPPDVARGVLSMIVPPPAHDADLEQFRHGMWHQHSAVRRGCVCVVAQAVGSRCCVPRPTQITLAASHRRLSAAPHASGCWLCSHLHACQPARVMRRRPRIVLRLPLPCLAHVTPRQLRQPTTQPMARIPQGQRPQMVVLMLVLVLVLVPTTWVVVVA